MLGSLSARCGRACSGPTSRCARRSSHAPRVGGPATQPTAAGATRPARSPSRQRAAAGRRGATAAAARMGGASGMPVAGSAMVSTDEIDQARTLEGGWFFTEGGQRQWVSAPPARAAPPRRARGGKAGGAARGQALQQVAPGPRLAAVSTPPRPAPPQTNPGGRDAAGYPVPRPATASCGDGHALRPRQAGSRALQPQGTGLRPRRPHRRLPRRLHSQGAPAAAPRAPCRGRLGDRQAPAAGGSKCHAPWPRPPPTHPSAHPLAPRLRLCLCPPLPLLGPPQVARDLALGSFERNAPLRAVELRTLLSGLGPSFVKIGQALSARPDLLPQVYLEALSDLQVGWGRPDDPSSTLSEHLEAYGVLPRGGGGGLRACLHLGGPAGRPPRRSLGLTRAAPGLTPTGPAAFLPQRGRLCCD
jgi:hypothetical protein